MESTAYAMEVNVKKTECMMMTKKENVPECRITIKGEMVKQVNNFEYLGSNITSDGRCVTEVMCHIAQAKRAFVELDNILKNKKMTIRKECGFQNAMYIPFYNMAVKLGP